MTEAATLVPDANGMLPNGLHQPTLHAVLMGLYVLADKEKRCVLDAVKQGHMDEVMLAVGTMSALMAFAGTVRGMPNFAATAIEGAIRDAPEAMQRADEQEALGSKLRDLLRDAGIAERPMSDLDVN